MTSTLDPTALLGQLTGYGLCVTLSVVLAVLVWRSPEAGRGARSVFAGCAAVWSLGGLMRSVLIAANFGSNSMPLTWIDCLSFSAAAIWPAGLSMLWNTKGNLTAAELAAGRWLVRIASVSAALLTFVLVGLVFRAQHAVTGHVTVGPFSGDQIRMAVAYNALAIMLTGFVLMRRHLRSAPERVGIGLMLLGPALSIAVHLISRSGLLPSSWDALAVVLRKQTVALTILGGLFFLGFFRASDRFTRLSLRVILAWSLGVFLAWFIESPLARLAALSAAPYVVSFACVAAVTVAGVFLFTLLGRAADRWVEHRVFGKVDPSLALRQLREDLSREETQAEVLALAEHFVSNVVQVDARILSSATESKAGRDRIPVRVGDTEPYVLVPAPRSGRRGLVSSELDLMRQVGELVGRRLEALERERERIDRSRREASLVHQLVEAELRALRAQINPHFLFNSLNTIAALVHQEPSIAEGMIVRLAKIFRHLLTQTERPFSSLAQEMDFLRAYLDIEKVRFGERLTVEFQISDSIRNCPVPSLILQPLVENAIKHGLAPKLGECRLLIGGSTEGGQIVLRVRDNGVGVRGDSKRSSTGIGMRNIRERLATLYGEQGRLLFESGPRTGSCATLYLPLAAP
jgi:two-component system LytT family sensor kinase